MDLTIIIVTYKCKDEVLACLETLYSGGLDGLDAEVVLIDNNSGDGIVEEVRSQFSEVITKKLPENIGFSAANNVALWPPKAKYVLFLNPDTLIPPGALKKCVDFLDTQSDHVAGMGCRVVMPSGETQWECNRRLSTPLTECIRALWPFSPPEALPKAALEQTSEAECLLGAFILCSYRALDKVGGFDERFFLMYEDIDLCKMLRNAGFALMYWPDVSITHVGGSSWKKEKIKTYANSHRSGLQYIQKHFPRSLWWVQFVVRLGMELRILALSLRRRDAWSTEHLKMARAAREALKNP